MNSNPKYTAYERLRRCKPLILAFCVVFSIMTVLGSTMAWFTASDSVTNPMKSDQEPGFLVRAVDVFNPSDPPNSDDSYNKRVGAVNLDGKSAFVRLLVTPVFVIADGPPDDPYLLLPGKFGENCFMDDFNAADWIDATDFAVGGDGYFYYKHILPGNTSTDINGIDPNITYISQNLFSRVSVDPQFLTENPGARLVIQVKAEAVGTKPAAEYVTSWWNGTVPPNSPTNPLRKVYDALQLLV